MFAGVLLACCLLGADPVADTKVLKGDLADLQGIWVLTAVRWAGGKPVEQEIKTDDRRLLNIQGRKCVEGKVNERSTTWFIRLDATTQPKRIDSGKSAAFKPGEVTYGIYELVGDDLEILWGGSTPEARPKEMKATGDKQSAGRGWILYYGRVE
jgi:uncharacterized protein (TIGR03067 family)